MARGFHPHTKDVAVATVTYLTTSKDVKMTGDGVFYAEFVEPSVMHKDRSLPKVKKAVLDELRARHGEVSIPFCSVSVDYGEGIFDRPALDVTTHRVIRIERGSGYFIGRGDRLQSICTRYDGEVFTTHLDDDDREEMQRLFDAAVAARQAVDDWLKKREFTNEIVQEWMRQQAPAESAAEK